MILYYNYTEHRRTIEDTFKKEDWSGYREDRVEWTLGNFFKKESLVPKPYYNSIEVDCSAKIKLVYAVCVRYSTGDTFSHTSGIGTVVGIFNNLKKAEEVQESINNGTYPISNPWSGYFETLEDCFIEVRPVY